MTPIKYAPFYALMQRAAASPPGAWLYARILHHVDRFALKLSGGRMTLTSLLAGLPVVMVTTTGARSGRPRTVPLVCIRDKDDPALFALIASNWGQRRHPAWYFNLKANPQATCAIASQAGQYAAHEALGEEYEKFWRYAADTYLGYPRYKQRTGGRRIPIMVMTPMKS